MHVARPLSVVVGQVCKLPFCVNYHTGSRLVSSNSRRWKLTHLTRKRNLIPTRAFLLTHPHTTHKGSNIFISRTRGRIYDPVEINHRTSRIGYFYVMIENLNHRSGAHNRKILVNQGVSNNFSYCNARILVSLLTKGRTNDLLGRNHCLHKTNQPFKINRIAGIYFLFFT